MSTDIGVRKTYKLYISGGFERSESGRTDKITAPDGSFLAHICSASRKDLKSAVQSSRSAASSWAKKSAYNRGQILYRTAEVLTHRKSDFIDELVLEGYHLEEAQNDVDRAIAVWVSYAGWTDKFGAIFSSVNPVASSHFNFSVPEPVGSVAIDIRNLAGLHAMATCLAPILCGGNSCLALVPSRGVLACMSFAEVLHTSDVPHGVVNLLSAAQGDVLNNMVSHRDLPSVVVCTSNTSERKELQILASANMKRIRFIDSNYIADELSSPYEIMAYQEIKTTWHPIGM